MEGDTRPSVERFSSGLFLSDTARQWAWFNKKSELVHAWARSHKHQASRPDQEYDPLPFKTFYDHVTDPNSPVTHEPSSWRYPVEIPVPQGFLSFDLPPPVAEAPNTPAQVLVGEDPNEPNGPRYTQLAYAPPDPRDGVWVLRDECRNWRWNDEVEEWYDGGTDLDTRISWEETVAEGVDLIFGPPPRPLFSHIPFPSSTTLNEPPHDLQIRVTSGIRGIDPRYMSTFNPNY